MLERKTIFNAGKIVGFVTTGFNDGTEIAKDEHGKLLGKSNSRFNWTRDAKGTLVATNSADVGLLFNRKS